MNSGSIVIDSFESKVLKNNPLGDPALRSFPVYLPHSYYSVKKKYPVVYLLTGFTGRGMMALNESFLSENIHERLDRLISKGIMKEMIVVMPDCITKYGGSQYSNSTATGRYEDYVKSELVNYIDNNYRTIGSSRNRAVMGKSSGGYGAVMLAMRNPDVFGLMCSTAGDMCFEYCYKPDFAKFVTQIERYGKGHKAITNFIKKELNNKQPKPKSFHNILNVIGMSSCYSPNLNGIESKGYNFDLPFDISTGELNESVFNKWLRKDPVNLVEKYRGNLQKLKLIFIDAGKSDEFNLNVGARIFVKKLKDYAINCLHEEFDDGHFNIQFRYDKVFEVISKYINSRN